MVPLYENKPFLCSFHDPYPNYFHITAQSVRFFSLFIGFINFSWHNIPCEEEEESAHLSLSTDRLWHYSIANERHTHCQTDATSHLCHRTLSWENVTSELQRTQYWLSLNMFTACVNVRVAKPSICILFLVINQGLFTLLLSCHLEDSNVINGPEETGRKQRDVKSQYIYVNNKDSEHTRRAWGLRW